MSNLLSSVDFKKYFHDRFVLLMLTVNIFVTFVTVATILLRLGDTEASYVQAYRSNLGLDGYEVGDLGQIISFIVFSVAVLIGQFFISMKFHSFRKHASWMIMIFGGLLLVLSLIVSNALLQLR